MLDESTPLEYFEHFGMKSGHDIEKFVASDDASIPGANPSRTESGLVFEKSAIAFFDCSVVESIDMGSHVMYVGEVVEARRLSDKAPITYDYYRNVTRKTGAAASASARQQCWRNRRMEVHDLRLHLRRRKPSIRFHLPNLQTRRRRFRAHVRK